MYQNWGIRDRWWGIGRLGCRVLIEIAARGKGCQRSADRRAEGHIEAMFACFVGRLSSGLDWGRAVKKERNACSDRGRLKNCRAKIGDWWN